jgi:ribonuclease BN (tRNA processing enzyme)
MEGASFVYIPDVEPYDYPVEKSQAKINENHELERALIDFVRDADVMLFDTTYTAEEYERLKGWGHSPMDYALEVAAKARVRRLGLFHYDPMREDSDIDKMVETLQTQGRRIGVDVFGSQEGMVLDIGGRESAGGKHS